MKTEKEIIEILENYLNVNDVIYAINIPNIASELTEGEEEKTCESCGDRFIPVDKVNYHCQKCQPCKAINTSEQKPTDEEIEEWSKDKFEKFGIASTAAAITTAKAMRDNPEQFKQLTK